MRILFLDDELYRHKEFRKNAIGATVDQAWTAEEALSLLSQNTYDLCFFDHDLAPEHYSNESPEDKNGQWLCREIIRRNINLPFCIVHSLNPRGGSRMIEILGTKYRGAALYVPFAWKLFEINDGRWILNFSKLT